MGTVYPYDSIEHQALRESFAKLIEDYKDFTMSLVIRQVLMDLTLPTTFDTLYKLSNARYVYGKPTRQRFESVLRSMEKGKQLLRINVFGLCWYWGGW